MTSFTAREDTNADIARELDLPDDPELPLRAFEKAEKKKRKKNKKAIMRDPPSSTLCTERSLSDLRARFGLGAVTLRRVVYAKKKEDRERRLAEEKRLAEAGLISPRVASPDATQDRDVAPDVAAPIDPTPAEAQEVDPTVVAPLPEVIVALPASDKAAGKRVRTDDSSSKKKSKKKKASSTEAGKEHPIFEDRVASGNLLGVCAGPLLPPPDTLLESRKYAQTDVASMNRMVHSDDSAMRNNMEAANRSVETLADEAGVTDQSRSLLPAEDIRPSKELD
ncbi:hypothetical protein ISN44_As04g005700 [Arabidopsis suecica]|uniref:Uncharacterized protein n=1 Tax=Arabidopsis suecica TaxID=45249 RepID=A0A8T2E6E4_ARASU|nr:hypothetical protein ISN44_As04g005700 [Arabidopsis suecica]